MAHPGRRTVLTCPLPVTAGLGQADLAAVVAADALARASADGNGDGDSDELVLPQLDGDLGASVTIDRAGRPADEVIAIKREAAKDALAALGVSTATFAPLVPSEAARVAFVRLYDEGLIERVEQVESVCPSCRTVVAGNDIVTAELEADVLTIELDDDFTARTVAAELLEGVVAVSVPVGHPLAVANATVHVPIAGRAVPVIAEIGNVEPAFVVPAHDRDAYALAANHGLAPRLVVGEDGVVVGDGSLAGLTRYAARAAARELLEAEGVVVDVTPGTELAERCRHCGSVTTPIVGTRWSLRAGDLEVEAADAVRDGLVTFVPPDARDAFLNAAGAGDVWWCLERSIPEGLPLPVATCDDCGRVSVEVDLTMTCAKCLGELRHDRGTLDARFVAALQPLALAGWPARRYLDDAPAATAVVTADALAEWLIPALALTRHLGDHVAFDAAVIHPLTAEAVDIDDDTTTEAARLVLLTMGTGTEPADAIEAAAALASPAPVSASDGAAAGIVDNVEAARAALGDGSGPALAASLFVAAIRGGVDERDAPRVRELAEPFVGDPQR